MVSALLVSLFVFAAEPQPEAAPQVTPPAAAPATTTAAAVSSDGARLVCRREAQPNTRFKTKVCKTVAEWEARAEAARAAFAEEQQRPMISTARGN